MENASFQMMIKADSWIKCEHMQNCRLRVSPVKVERVLLKLDTVEFTLSTVGVPKKKEICQIQNSMVIFLIFENNILNKEKLSHH